MTPDSRPGKPAKSGARLERPVIDGQRYVLKHMNLATDWTTERAEVRALSSYHYLWPRKAHKPGTELTPARDMSVETLRRSRSSAAN